MGRRILVADTNQGQCRELCSLLENARYRAQTAHSLSEMEKTLAATPCHALILDVDSLGVDNRYLARLKQRHPRVCLFLISSRAFHPDLVEAMRDHVFACLRKPVNPEELIYMIRSTCV